MQSRLLCSMLMALMLASGVQGAWLETWPVPTNVTAFPVTTNGPAYMQDLWSMFRERTFASNDWAISSTMMSIVGTQAVPTNVTSGGITNGYTNQFFVYTNTVTEPTAIRYLMMESIKGSVRDGNYNNGTWILPRDNDWYDAWLLSNATLPLLWADQWATNYPSGIYAPPTNSPPSGYWMREPFYDTGSQGDAQSLVSSLLLSAAHYSNDVLNVTYNRKTYDVYSEPPVIIFKPYGSNSMSGSVTIKGVYQAWPPMILDDTVGGDPTYGPYDYTDYSVPFYVTNEVITASTNEQALSAAYTYITNVTASGLPTNAAFSVYYPTNATRSHCLAHPRNVTRATFNWRYFGMINASNYPVTTQWRIPASGDVYRATWGVVTSTITWTSEASETQGQAVAWAAMTNRTETKATSDWFDPGGNRPERGYSFSQDTYEDPPGTTNLRTSITWTGNRAKLQFVGPTGSVNTAHTAYWFTAAAGGSYLTMSTNRLQRYSPADIASTTNRVITNDDWIGAIAPGTFGEEKFSSINLGQAYFAYEWDRP